MNAYWPGKKKSDTCLSACALPNDKNDSGTYLTKLERAVLTYTLMISDQPAFEIKNDERVLCLRIPHCQIDKWI